MDILPDNIPWTAGNQLQLLNSGAEFFPALINAIDAAQREIFLETYLFANDATGQAVAGALTRAAKRSVRVCVLVDGFGARNFMTDFGKRFQDAGVRYLSYRPAKTAWRFRRSQLRRLHRKLAVIDREIAFVGGINIIDDHNTPAGVGTRIDYAVVARGPITEQVYRAALREWTLVARSGFQAHLQRWTQQWLTEYRQLRHQDPNEIFDNSANTGPQARFLPRDNIRHRHCIVNAYLAAIETAQTSVLLAHAYFLPGFRIRHALREAAQRGVKVTILLQGSSDHWMLQFATRALYGSLLKEGISLYEYTSGFLHAKVGVIDGLWLTVGSSNMDPFSIYLAHEGNLEIRDTLMGEMLTQDIQRLIENDSTAITSEQLTHTPWLSRVARWSAYGLVRLLIALAGYGASREMR